MGIQRNAHVRQRKAALKKTADKTAEKRHYRDACSRFFAPAFHCTVRFHIAF
jgi:hypothetical protein